MCIQKMHRVFALFVWKSAGEPMRRDNLFRRVSMGGLGLPHLFLRQVVSRFFFVRDQTNPLIQVMLQTRLSAHIPFFFVPSDIGPPAKLVGFVKEVVDAVNFLVARYSLDYLSIVSRKKLYRDLLDNLFPVPMYRSRFANEPGQDVLVRVKKMCIMPSAKTFFFRLHSDTLPVKLWLDRRGMIAPGGVNCPLCKVPETIEHCFVHCWDAVFFWDVLQRTLKKDLFVTPRTIRFLSMESHESLPLDMIMVLGLYSLWKSRMTVRHAEPFSKTARVFFVEFVAQVKSVYDQSECPPEWINVLDNLTHMKEF